MYKYFFKRILDILFSLIALILLSPILLIVAIAVKLNSKGPIFFKQKRIGNHKKPFSILKFRTMPVDVPHDTPTHLFKDGNLLNKFQRFLRKTSLDELPQLFCIFIGTMSFIGPRPALWNQYDLIEERDKYGANDVKPGLTGWAQVNGRDELEIPLKAKLDGEYTQKLNAGWFRGFFMDVKCFFKTITFVLRRKGVVEGGTGSEPANKE